MVTTPHERPALRAMCAEVGLAVVALAVTYADHATGNVLAGLLAVALLGRRP